ncbi:hypothetical protein ABH917_003651 [Thermobifida halotolerans]
MAGAPTGPARARAATRADHRRVGTSTVTVRVNPESEQWISLARFSSAVRRASAQACSAPRAASSAPASAARSAAVAAR